MSTVNGTKEKVEVNQKSLPSFQTYGNYSSNNYGAHALLNAIDGGDKKTRVNGEEFERMLKQALA